MARRISVDHDLHQHSTLSACSRDAGMTPGRMLANAVEQGYDTICVTDHVWDAAVPGASGWYAPQTVAHIRGSLPLPQAPGVRFCFGCETEYCGDGRLGLARESFGLFDFIIVPVNHFHMKGFVRPASVSTPRAAAELMLSRLAELVALDLPWAKTGIAHFTTDLVFPEGEAAEVFDAMDGDALLELFGSLARKGAGIELNAEAFKGWARFPESFLRPYRLAKQAGCRFYFGSDAHEAGQLAIKERLRPVADALALKAGDLYRIPSSPPR